MDADTITFTKVVHEGRELLAIGFRYDLRTEEYVKGFEGVLWSPALKSFYVPFSRQTTGSLFKYLRKRDYYIDYSALKARTAGPDLPLVRERTKITGTVCPEVLDQIDGFKRWMGQKRYSPNTINTYESMLQMFFGFHHTKSVGDIVRRDLEDFNTDYILANGYSFTYQNQMISAIKLFYSHIELENPLIGQLQRPRKQHRLPEVLSINEVKSILGFLSNLKHKTLLSLLYACGLRIGECLNIRLQDLDIERGFTHIRSGKGHKDRYVPVPRKMCVLLKRYIAAYCPKDFLFEGSTGPKYSPVSARQVLKRALLSAGLKKSVTLHTLRHSHATHLLESGTDIRYIQELLGHNSPKTTMIYTHVSSTSLDKIKNPFDEFEI